MIMSLAVIHEGKGKFMFSNGCEQETKENLENTV